MSEAPRSRGLEQVVLPAHIVVHREPGAADAVGDPYRSSAVRDDLLFEVRWNSRARPYLAAFVALWWVFLVGWYFLVSFADAPLEFYLVVAVFAAAGLYMSYRLVALYVNRTLVALSGELLTVRHTPLPWPGAVELPVLRIEQLYVSEGVAFYVNDRPLPGFSLIARMRDGGEVTLVKDLPEPEQVRYLEQVIEDALGVTDRAVPGELER